MTAVHVLPKQLALPRPTSRSPLLTLAVHSLVPRPSVWVEALNPVLDDNRTLCLSSGETIPLREAVNLIMEVRLGWGCCTGAHHDAHE